MSPTCPFAQPVRDFLAYLRVEAGLAPATLEAYGRDIRDLVDDLRRGGAAAPESVTSRDLVTHVRALHRERHGVALFWLVAVVDDDRTALALGDHRQCPALGAAADIDRRARIDARQLPLLSYRSALVQVVNPVVEQHLGTEQHVDAGAANH